MKFASKFFRLHRVGGFTLAEGLIAVGVLSLFVMACFSSISFNRVAAAKAKEEAIVMDFLVHYTEAIKGMGGKERVEWGEGHLAEARAAYLASPGNHQRQQSDICDWEVRKEIPPHPTDQMIVTGDTVWRQFVALVRTSKRPWRR